jgi:hypothetical protein
MKAHTKEVIQYSTAVVMIASAIILAFVSFILTYTIGAGVLTYVGEAFGSGLAIFGIASYFKHDLTEFKQELKREYENELRRSRQPQQP